MYKLGSFSALYIIPAIVMCFCDLYHVFVLFNWYPTTTACKLSGGAEGGNCQRASQPVVSWFADVAPNHLFLFRRKSTC